MNKSPANKAVGLEEFKTLHSVPLEVQAELDRKMMSVGDLLALRVGDVVTLPRAAGENINVYAGGALIGWGEVLVMERLLAVRIADLRNTPPPIADFPPVAPERG